MKKLLFLLNILPFLVSAQSNYAMDFNGLNASVDLGSAVGNTNIRSIEFWFKPNVTINASSSLGGWGLIARNDDHEMYEYGFYIRGNEWSNNIGALVFSRRDNGVDHEVFSNSNSWVANTWYHVAGTIDTVMGMRMYINGVLQNSTDPSTLAVQTDVNTTNIAVWGNSNLRYFNGTMDEMRIWNRAIPQSEIQNKMCQELIPANESGLVAYWKFNEGGGQQLTDATPNGYNGTASNVVWVHEWPCGTHDSKVSDLNEGQTSIVVISPNPATSVVTINLAGDHESASYLLYNSLGEKVAAGALNKGENEIDISRIGSGVYSICVDREGARVSKKLVVQK